MAYTPRAGNNGTATIATNELPVIGWSVDPIAVVVSFTNSKSGNHPQRLPTFTDGGMVTIDIDHDDTNNVYGAPYSIRVGSVITATKLFLDGSAGSRFWNYPSLIVQRTPQSVEVTGKIATRLVCIADGQFAPPGQSLF